MTSRPESPEEAKQRLSNEALSDVERAALRRIRDSQRRRTRSRAGLLIAVLGPPAVVAAFLFMVRREMNEEVAHHDPCTLDARHKKLALAPGCAAAQRVPIDGDVWELQPGAEVERTKTGVHVRRGRVRFKVRPRYQTAAFRVRVSAGEVRVIGTELEIVDEAGRGSLFVREGVVELAWADGARQRIAAGERVEWPRAAAQPAARVDEPNAAAPAASAQAAQPAGAARRPDAGTRAQAPPALDIDQVMDRLLQLKSQARHADAVVLLEGTLRARGLGAVQRERISYELGLALESSGRAACAHWREHAARFGSARFGAALERRLSACK